MKYSEKQVMIGGVKTNIFTPQNAKLLLNDTDLLKKLKIHRVYLEAIQNNIQVAGHYFNKHLFLTIFQLHNQWLSSLCIKIDEDYIDVKYHEKWFCRCCCETIAENVLVPEEDAGVFFPKESRYKYPPIFHFMLCPKCGKRTDRDLLPENEFQKLQEI